MVGSGIQIGAVCPVFHLLPDFGSWAFALEQAAEMVRVAVCNDGDENGYVADADNGPYQDYTSIMTLPRLTKSSPSGRCWRFVTIAYLSALYSRE